MLLENMLFEAISSMLEKLIYAKLSRKSTLCHVCVFAKLKNSFLHLYNEKRLQWIYLKCKRNFEQIFQICMQFQLNLNSFS